MQKFPEDDLLKRRRALMYTETVLKYKDAETVLDYKKRMDDARAEAAAKNPFMADAEKFAKIYEELKAGTKKFYDMHVLEQGRHEFMSQHFFNLDAKFESRTMGGRMEAYHTCPICEAEKKRANIQQLIDIESPADASDEFTRDAATRAARILRNREDRAFLDMLEKYLPAGAGPWPPPRPDPMYRIEGTRRSMHDNFVRRMQRELESAEPIMQVTCSDPTKSKAEVWKAVKDFMGKARKDKTVVPVLPADIKIEPLTPGVLRDGFSLISRERPRDCWDKAREALRRLPGDTPLFYNEVLGEYSGTQIGGNRVDAVYIDEISKMGPNLNGDDFTAEKAAVDFEYWERMICEGLGVPKEMLTPASDAAKAAAQALYAERKISKEMLLERFGIKAPEPDEEP